MAPRLVLASGGRGPVRPDLPEHPRLVLLHPHLLGVTFRVTVWLTAQLGRVLFRCFQLDLDLRTRRVPQLAGVGLG